MQACSIMLSSSIDTSIISHVFDVLEAGNSARFSPRYTSSAVLYASELYIHRCAQVTSHHTSSDIVLQCFNPTNLTLHSVTMKAIYDSTRSRSSLPAESDALPESVRDMLRLRPRLQALLTPYELLPLTLAPYFCIDVMRSGTLWGEECGCME